MTEEAKAGRKSDARMIDRLLFFSDAAFAIVLTLLVLDLHAPALASLKGATAWSQLREIAPHLYSFVFSFGMVAMWWFVHMHVTRDFARFDYPTAILNVMFLLAMTLMPFVASLLGGSDWKSNEALAIYWLVNSAAAFSMMGMALVATRDGGKVLAIAMPGVLRAFSILSTGVPGAAFVAAAWFTLHGHATGATIVVPILTLAVVGASRLVLAR